MSLLNIYIIENLSFPSFLLKLILLRSIFVFVNFSPSTKYLRNCDEEFAPMHKHIHWKQLVQYIVKYPEVHFMLIHFSMRYKNEEVIDFFNEKRSQLGISNFSPWLN